MITLLTLETVASDAPADSSSFGENLLAALFLAVFVWFGLKSWRKSSAARARAWALTPDEAGAVEKQILERLHYNDSMRIDNIAREIGEHPKFIFARAKKMLDRGYLKLVHDSDSAATANEFSWVSLTTEGDRLLKQKDPVLNMSFSSEGGDLVYAEQNSTINNRSILVNSQNRLKEKYDDDVLQALRRIEEVVRQEGSPEAVELLGEFLDEAAEPNPRPTRLRAFFRALEHSAPTISTMTDVVARVSTLFQ